MIKLLKKYGVELKLKKCDLFRLIEGQKDTFLEDGFAFKMTNEEEMFKYVEENNIEIDIEADGGIKVNNVQNVKTKGANIIVSGSGIINSDNYGDTIKKMKEEI